MRPKIFHASDHDIDPTFIDQDALYVISTLRQAGFAAFLVGGGVRDLLVKKKPKDFDISTSATPEEVKRLFKRSCLLIGRRFRLAHIRFGHKVIEVSTFRSGDTSEGDLIVRDNRWGSEEEDALRRDFTINGLFYDPEAHQVIDYVGGWDDIHKGVLRTIGDAEARFRQDPVRMIRALKFRARFGFALDAETESALRRTRREIVKSSPARILEEIFRMLESGAAAPFFRLMTDYHLMELLFPTMSHFLTGSHGGEIYRFLTAADEVLVHAGKPIIDRSVLSSCLLFPILQREVEKQFVNKGLTPHMGDVSILTTSLIEGVVTHSFSHFPRRISGAMAFILSTQFRFTPLTPKKHYRPALFRDKDFPLALQFLKLRALLDSNLVETYTEWKNLYRRAISPPHRKVHPSPDHQKASRE